MTRVVFIFFVLAALLAPYLAPYTLEIRDLSRAFETPTSSHWLGLNHHGQDLFTLLLYGARISICVGLLTVVISSVAGITLGLLAGYLGGFWDGFISRLVEIVLAFPGILLAIAIAAVLGPSFTNIVIALSLYSWVPFARLARAQTLSLRERDFVSAARALGAGKSRIMFLHIFPNLFPPLIVQATFSMAAAILAESSLSFLGSGVPPGVPSWGKAIADGARYLLQAPHLAIFPGIVMMICVMSLNFLGDGLRDRWHARV